MDGALMILAFLLVVVAPFAAAHLWWWVGFWGSLALVLAAWEIAAKIKTGRTLSQQFWRWQADGHRGESVAVMACASVFWLALVYHLVVQKW